MTLRRKTLINASAVVVVACGVTAACLDLTPIVYETAPRREAGIVSADVSTDVVLGASDASDAGAPDVNDLPPCIRCVTTPDDATPPGCDDEIAACLALPECAATYACTIANDCLEQPNFRDIVNCALPCAEEAGITSVSNPAIPLIYNFAICAQANCNGPCDIGDASIPD